MLTERSKEMVVAVLLKEIETQCTFVSISYDKLQQTLHNPTLQQAQQRASEAAIHRDTLARTPNRTSEAFEQARVALHQARQEWETLQGQQSVFVLFYIQSLLVAAANVSKLLWKYGKGRGESLEEHNEDLRLREQLRATLAIERDMQSYVFGKRELRNHYEHYDERIVNHLRSSNIVVEGMGAIASVANLDEENILRFYNSTTNSISFKKDEVDLRALVEEIKWLQEQVKVAQKVHLQAQVAEWVTSNRNQSKDMPQR